MRARAVLFALFAGCASPAYGGHEASPSSAPGSDAVVVPLGGARLYERPRREVFAAAKVALEVQNYPVVLASADESRIMTGRRLLKVESREERSGGARTVSHFRQFELSFETFGAATRVSVRERQFLDDTDISDLAARKDPTFTPAWQSLLAEVEHVLGAPPQPSPTAPTPAPPGARI